MSENAGGRKSKRKLTPFLAHQMLYDYATDQLDAERRSAVEEFLETDQEGRTLLANLRQALGYVDKLGLTQIDQTLLAQLKDAESPVSLGRRYSSWSQWPEPIRWSLTAIAISCVVAGLVGLIPWTMLNGLFHRSKGPADVVQVAEIPRPGISDIEAAEEPVGSGDAEVESESSGDEEMGDEGEVPPAALAKGDPNFSAPPPKPTPSPTPIAKASPTPAPKAPGALAVATPSVPNAIAPSTPAPATPPPQASAQTTATTSTSDEEGSGETNRDGKPKGFVYRAFMNVAHIDDITPQITDAIRGLGGEKAGEVELGWKRGGGRYYHFALPEENEKKLLDKLQAYGPVRISKDPHPRVMPVGRVRFILWVESQ